MGQVQVQVPVKTVTVTTATRATAQATSRLAWLAMPSRLSPLALAQRLPQPPVALRLVYADITMYANLAVGKRPLQLHTVSLLYLSIRRSLGRSAVAPLSDTVYHIIS